MKLRFRLFKRTNGNWFWEDSQTHQQGSLHTQDKREAQRLLNAKKKPSRIPP